ncbi:MAG TPA: hypothetical protein VFP74_13600, partial [Pseudolabrys sp.]|nr:hypothetical protein [Pseudolabrys sp.]
DKVVGLGAKIRTGAQDADELPYVILLCEAESAKAERVLARAASAQLARAIFNSAQTEFPGRRIMLQRGGETMLDSER